MPGETFVAPGLFPAIGQTPLIYLNGPSAATGCAIYGKAEFMNPGGSVKDRAALAIVQAAEAAGTLKPGGLIVEGTAGNTGIGLALVGNARGYRSLIVMPETQSQEKIDFLRLIGAEVMLVPAKPFKDPGNYVHVARRVAEERAATEPNGVLFADQFENLANRNGHAATTGPELLAQVQAITGKAPDAFTCAVGTGGTLAGISAALKASAPTTKIFLADPHGSVLYNWAMGAELVAEGTSITEGIGQGRVPGNLAGVALDGAVRVSDTEALTVVFDLLKHDGLCVGGSAGVNVAAAMQVARTLGPGHTIVTILCDGGARYQSKLFNPDFLRARNLPVPSWLG
jgi:cysteine synthase A